MIEGKRVNLRLLREADLDEYYELTSRLSIIGEFWPIELSSIVQLRKQFAKDGLWNDNWGRILITSKQDKLIGNIDYFRGIPYIDGYELGFRIYHPEDRGNGYMTEAVKLFINYLFALKPINRLQICFDPKNISSKKVAENCGFKYEGTMRQSSFDNGKYLDVEMYSLLRNERQP